MNCLALHFVWINAINKNIHVWLNRKCISVKLVKFHSYPYVLGTSFTEGWVGRIDFILRMEARHVGVSKAYGGSLADLFKYCARLPTETVSAWILEADGKNYNGRTFYNERVQGLKADLWSSQHLLGGVTTADIQENKQCCSHCENDSAEPSPRFTRVFLSSWGILEERDNMLLPPWEPYRNSCQFSSLNSFSRTTGNML